ncbi:DUF3360 family protein [Vibrio chagasii]|nr:DUF3360 family protein [Vibrio chagasii]
MLLASSLAFISKGGSMLANLTSKGACVAAYCSTLALLEPPSSSEKLFVWPKESVRLHRVCRILTIIFVCVIEHFRKRWLAVPLSCLLVADDCICHGVRRHLLSTEPPYQHETFFMYWWAGRW